MEEKQFLEPSRFGFVSPTPSRRPLPMVSTQKCPLGSRMTISLSDSPYRCHCHVRYDGLTTTVTVDEDYPARVAFNLITQTMRQFEQLSGDRWKLQDKDLDNQPQFMKDDLASYQDPRNVDKMAKVQDVGCPSSWGEGCVCLGAAVHTHASFRASGRITTPIIVAESGRDQGYYEQKYRRHPGPRRDAGEPHGQK